MFLVSCSQQVDVVFAGVGTVHHHSMDKSRKQFKLRRGGRSPQSGQALNLALNEGKSERRTLGVAPGFPTQEV